MSSGIISRVQGWGGAGKYFGSSAPQRAIFVILVSILAWTLAVLLVVVMRFADPPYPLSLLFYAFVVFHLLPWATGLRNLRRIRKALDSGTIDTPAANLSYSVVLGMILNTYVVLCSGEVLAILAFRLAGLHSGLLYQ
jgi:hypothetical protein